LSPRISIESMPQAELSKYARHPWVPYVDRDGSIKYYPSLSWCSVEPDGTIVADMDNEPEVAAFYPPLEECDGRRCYRRWLQYDFVVFPNYEIEELGEDYVVVRRSDGVRFKLVGWLYRTILLELSKHTGGVDFMVFVQLMLGWMAQAKPEVFRNPTDEVIARHAEYVVQTVGLLYYEFGLVEPKGPK